MLQCSQHPDYTGQTFKFNHQPYCYGCRKVWINNRPTDKVDNDWAPCSHTDEDEQLVKDWLDKFIGFENNLIVLALYGELDLYADQWVGVGYTVPDPKNERYVEFWVEGDSFELAIAKLVELCMQRGLIDEEEIYIYKDSLIEDVVAGGKTYRA